MLQVELEGMWSKKKEMKPMHENDHWENRLIDTASRDQNFHIEIDSLVPPLSYKILLEDLTKPEKNGRLPGEEIVFWHL